MITFFDDICYVRVFLDNNFAIILVLIVKLVIDQHY